MAVFTIPSMAGSPTPWHVHRFPGRPGSLLTARTERRCCQLRGCRAARLPVSAVQAAQDAQRCRQARNGIVTFIAAGAPSLDRQEIGFGQRCGVPLPGDCLACLPAGPAVSWTKLSRFRHPGRWGPGGSRPRTGVTGVLHDPSPT